MRQLAFRNDIEFYKYGLRECQVTVCSQVVQLSSLLVETKLLHRIFSVITSVDNKYVDRV